MSDRFAFMNCPFCSGHEAMSTAAVDRIEALIKEHVGNAEEAFPELENVCNVIESSREPGRAKPIKQEETWLDA